MGNGGGLDLAGRGIEEGRDLKEWREEKMQSGCIESKKIKEILKKKKMLLIILKISLSNLYIQPHRQKKKVCTF